MMLPESKKKRPDPPRRANIDRIAAGRKIPTGAEGIFLSTVGRPVRQEIIQGASRLIKKTTPTNQHA